MNGQPTPRTYEPIQSSEEFEKAFQELGRALTVYWTFQATGLLDRQSTGSRGDDIPHRTSPDNPDDSG